MIGIKGELGWIRWRWAAGEARLHFPSSWGKCLLSVYRGLRTRRCSGHRLNGGGSGWRSFHASLSCWCSGWRECTCRFFGPSEWRMTLLSGSSRGLPSTLGWSSFLKYCHVLRLPPNYRLHHGPFALWRIRKHLEGLRRGAWWWEGGFFGPGEGLLALTLY
jgi:hypothetical protein